MADNATTTTLRHVLTQQKPFVPCKTKSSKNTKIAQWPVVPRGSITLWKDFNLDTLNKSYGHILDREVPAAELAHVPLVSNVLNLVEIVKQDDILKLIDWNNQILNPTLHFAKERLGLHRGAPLLLTISAYDKSSVARVKGGQRMAKVDHCIGLSCYPLPDLVLGLGRQSRKFPARQVADKPEFASDEVLWPLRQLANMCDIAGTRYGYIMTEEHFVACCFHKSEAEPAESAAGPATRPVKKGAGSQELNLALMPVPWAQHGREQLSTDLALWWMSMLALSDSDHRALVPKADMVGINEWEPAYFDEERGWVHRHRYSKREERTSQPPPPAYRTPSPGNQAAFEAAVGINMDPNFDLYDAGVVDGSFFGDYDHFDDFNVVEDIADVYAPNS